MKQIFFKILKLNENHKWFSAELYINDLLVLGEGCHFSDKKRIKEIKSKFKARLFINKESE